MLEILGRRLGVVHGRLQLLYLQELLGHELHVVGHLALDVLLQLAPVRRDFTVKAEGQPLLSQSYRSLGKSFLRRKNTKNTFEKSKKYRQA